MCRASGSNLNKQNQFITPRTSSRDSYSKRSEFSSQANYVSSNKRDLPRFFIDYRRKALEIPAFFNKFSRSTIKQLFGKAKDLQFIPAIALAGYLVPPLGNASRNSVAVSHENKNTVVERSMNHSPCEVEQRKCGDIKYGSSNCSASAVEPRTGIEFPTILDNIFGGGNSSFNTEVLVGTGSKTMKIIKIKSLKLYAFGFYVHPYDVCNKLGSKYASLPDDEVKTHDNFFSDLLREDISMTLRLVVSCNGIKISTVRDAFEKSLQARLIKMNPDTDYDCLKSFGSLFKEDIPIRAGTTIKIQRTADGHLVTEIEGNRIGAVQSKDLCRAFFDMYIGDGPVSEETKTEIGENVASHLHSNISPRRCGIDTRALLKTNLLALYAFSGHKILGSSSAFEKSLQARLIKMNPDTDYDCLKSFGSLFKEDIIRAVIVGNNSIFVVFCCISSGTKMVFVAALGFTAAAFWVVCFWLSLLEHKVSYSWCCSFTDASLSDRADVCGFGTVKLKFTSGKVITLQNVYHVPSIPKCLISVSKLDEHGFKITFESRKVVISKHGVFVGKGYILGGMYRVDDSCGSVGKTVKTNVSVVEPYFETNEKSVCTISLWHKRLAHTNVKNIEKMKNNGLIKFQNKDFEKCETCVKSKFVKKPFPTVKRETTLLELIHSDICELNGILTRGGKRYFITFCDDSSRYLYVYLLRSKDEAFDSFKVYKAEVENQLGKRIKILRSDRGGEYFTGMFDAFCEENGIKHERTYTPQQNGLAERKNRTLVEMVNCMLNQSGLPTNLWGEALLAACHIHNRITSRVILTSPYELWKGIRSVFVGYAKNSKAYRLLDERTGVIIESRDVDFFEDKFSNDVENSHAELVPTPCGSSHGETSTEINEPRRSIRARKEKDFGSYFFSYLVEGTQKKVTREVIFTINIDDDPKTFSEAMSSRDAPMWKEAIKDEMDSILGNQTWELAELPKGVRPIGYRQKEGIDYFDTYAPVARISSIRTLIAISAVKGLYIHQMVVKTALLVKSLYGLKQAPKQWHERFDTTVTSFGFQHNSADRCIYTKSTKEYTVVICLYVDDMLIIGTTLDGILETKSYLSSNFKMKDLGEATCEIKECNTPFDTSVKLEVNSGRAVAQLEYASVIGSLMYAMHCTRPDIAFAVSKLSQYTSNPSLEHWDAVSRVLGYLKRTSALQLTYTSYPGVLEGYSDASWINHSGDSKSTSGWIYTLAGGAVSWASKKQTCISHLLVKLNLLPRILLQALRMSGISCDLLMDIRLWPGPMPSIPMYCDSKAALSIAYNSVYNGKSRHLRLRHNYVRQLVKNGTISVVYVKSCRNLADPLTKPLTRDLFSATTITLQICDVATQGTKMAFVAALGFTAAAFWVMNPDTDYDCLKSFGSLFKEDIPIRALKAIGLVQFRARICAELSLTYMYIGDGPVSEETKTEIGENVVNIMKRC
ncbi:retrovirus-related pol polyprotein from transposon TNT 1-94 [Tanacetum coccineum]